MTGRRRILDEVLVPIISDKDIVTARQRGRRMAEEFGFRSFDSTLIATAISEVGRNIVCYATRGEIILRLVDTELAQGIEVIAVDEGPGIPDVALVVREGYSTSRSLGLAGIRHLMDEFEISSQVGAGTTVTSLKWRR
jgi:serine/threonine-protein kinase RsbT